MLNTADAGDVLIYGFFVVFFILEITLGLCQGGFELAFAEVVIGRDGEYDIALLAAYGDDGFVVFGGGFVQGRDALGFEFVSGNG